MRPFITSLLLSEKKDLEIAEIGVKEGKNALEMLLNLPIKRLHLIDPYLPYKADDKFYTPEEMQESYEKMLKNMTPYLPDKVKIYELSSVEAAKLFDNESLDAVYIDADHTAECVEEDIRAWFPKLRMKGLLGGHDFKNYEVIKGVAKIFHNAFNEDWLFDKILPKIIEE